MKIFELKKFSTSKEERELYIIADAGIITFEELTEVINTVIQPDEVSGIEITSWTEAFVFDKGDISVYVEHFYHSNPYYSFEFYPFENDNKQDKQKLLQIINQLDEYLSNRN